jgi:ribosomal protein L11 methyltransferase
LAEYPALEIQFPVAADASLHDRLYLLLDDFEPVAIHEDEPGHRWRVFFRSGERRDAAAASMAATLPPGLVRASSIDVPDEDWARRSQESLKAIEAGGLIIAPPWDVPKAQEQAGRAKGGGRTTEPLVIIIEPSTGFGTGHHATTRLCLLLMQRLELRGARVLDIGAGSGVLALAAWKLGASDVVAIDSDPDALDNARDNIARNGAAPSIDIIRDDLATLRIERGDVVLANLTGAVLVRYADELRGLARDGGYFVLSGFAPRDAAVIRTAFGGLSLVEEKVEGEWAALCLTQSPKPKTQGL